VGPRGREAQEILPEGFAEWPSVCLSAVGYPPQVKNMWSKETVTTPLAFNAAWCCRARRRWFRRCQSGGR
jgi:hypothetical protein